MASGILEDLANFYKSKLSPLVQDALADTFNFFAYLGVDSVEASKYGAKAFATIFAVVIVAYFLLRSTAKIGRLFDFVFSLLGWLLTTVKSTAKFAEERLAEAFRAILTGITDRSFYKRIVLWCAMSDEPDDRRMRESYKDGPVQAKYQRNMGMAVLAVATWSAMSFAYAVFAAGTSFRDGNAFIGIIAVVGAILYGLLILTLDRSIVAPFTPAVASEPSKQPPDISARLTAWASDNIGIVFKTVVRITIAVLVAKFTALPLTMLILHGGIVDHLQEKSKADRDKILEEATGLRQGRENFIVRKTESATCNNANRAVADSTKRIDEIAKSGCPRGWTTCGGKRTIAMELQHERYLSVQREACVATEAELKPFDDALSSANSRAAATSAGNIPDILQGALALEEIAKKHNNSSHFNPIVSTFYFLIVIELIPVFMKLWREALTNRRVASERRGSLLNSDSAASAPDRRNGDRRALSVVAVPSAA